MGLLPKVARGVGVTMPAASHLISAYALGVGVGALLAVGGLAAFSISLALQKSPWAR